jgi:ribonucleoside-diphosphate reductase subunit M1
MTYPARLEALAARNPQLHIDVRILAEKVPVDDWALLSRTAADMTILHPDWSLLAARICIDHLKEHTQNFEETIKLLGSKNILMPDLVDFVIQNPMIGQSIDETLDDNLSYMSWKTLERSYLQTVDGNVVERPQYMFMRVAVGIHYKQPKFTKRARLDLDNILSTYKYMSQGYFIHATPTLYNAGTISGQLSSCFLLTIPEDSLESIYSTLHHCAMISKSAGGIGLSVSKLRVKGSTIAGRVGTGSGIIPVLKVYNETARYVNQEGRRPGSIAVYLEPWHADVLDFLQLRKNRGDEGRRARDLFLALWIPDLFMTRVENDQDWSLMCPNVCKGLDEVYGDDFVKLYESYEAQEKFIQKLPARKIWDAIIESQIETGTPYMLYKDACNAKSNQKNLGVIKCSNLCAEIVEYSDVSEFAVCNLGNIALPKFIVDGVFDFVLLGKVTKVLTTNLNKVIDINNYPLFQTRYSNVKHRPIGIGVQGLADVFQILKMSFESDEARQLNKSIFECIYYHALEQSNELSAGTSYMSFKDSPAACGILQYDFWDAEPSSRWNWQQLKDNIVKTGLRNSLVTAVMPTASTAHILGNNESIEPYTSNMYTRRILAGEFQMVNRWLVADLMALGLWNDTTRQQITKWGGSVQKLNIPDHIKALYKTVWEIPQKTLIDMAVDRAAFVDQSQSMNIFLASPTYEKLTSMHFYGWKAGLKTGMYYLRTRPTADAIQFTIDDKLCAGPTCTSCT